MHPANHNLRSCLTLSGEIERSEKPRVAAFATARLSKNALAFLLKIFGRDFSEAPHRGFIILRENPSRDYFHPATEDDIRSALSRLPQRILRPLKAVVLSRLSARHGVEARRRYQCVVL